MVCGCEFTAGRLSSGLVIGSDRFARVDSKFCNCPGWHHSYFPVKSRVLCKVLCDHCAYWHKSAVEMTVKPLTVTLFSRIKKLGQVV